MHEIVMLKFLLITALASKQMAKRKKNQTAEQRMKQNEQEREKRSGKFMSLNRQRELEIARISEDKQSLLRQLTKAHEEKQHFKELSIKHKVEL